MGVAVVIAQARSILRTGEGQQWFLVEGDSKESVLEQLRVRASLACGKAAVTMLKTQGVKREVALASLFPEGQMMFVIEVKWGDTEEPDRVELVLSKDGVIGDVMAKMIGGVVG